MVIIVLFRLGSDKLSSCLFTGFLLSLPRDQSPDVTPRLGEVADFLFFDWSSFCFWLLNCALSISYFVLTCYVYYYFILFGFNTLFSCFFCKNSTVLSQGICHGMWLFSWEFLLFSSSLHFAFKHLSDLLFRQCSNMCAEALVVYRNSSLPRLAAV